MGNAEADKVAKAPSAHAQAHAAPEIPAVAPPVVGTRPATAQLVRPGPKFRPEVLSDEMKARPHFYTQSYKPETLVVLAILCVHALVYCSAADFVLPLVSGYVHTDAYLAALHMWLDDPSTLENAVPVIAKLAWEFQHHHDYPDDVFHKNHVLSIDLFVRATLLFWLASFWLFGLETWTVTHLLSTSLWGFVGAANHVAMHARTHGKKVPRFYTLAQDVGIFMQPKHHKMHHTAPFDCYFSFLQARCLGFNVVYTVLYNRLLRHNRTLMTAFFVALQPPVMILALLGSAAIRASPLPALVPTLCGTAARAQALALSAIVVAFVPMLLRKKAAPPGGDADVKAHSE